MSAASAPRPRFRPPPCARPAAVPPAVRPRCLADRGRPGDEPEGAGGERAAGPPGPGVGHPRRHRPCRGSEDLVLAPGESLVGGRRRAHGDGAVGQLRRDLQLGRQRPTRRPERAQPLMSKRGRSARKRSSAAAPCERMDARHVVAALALRQAHVETLVAPLAARALVQHAARRRGAGRPAESASISGVTAPGGPSMCWQKRMPSNTSRPVMPALGIARARLGDDLADHGGRAGAGRAGCSRGFRRVAGACHGREGGRAKCRSRPDAVKCQKTQRAAPIVSA